MFKLIWLSCCCKKCKFVVYCMIMSFVFSPQWPKNITVKKLYVDNMPYIRVKEYIWVLMKDIGHKFSYPLGVT